jgi:hypothetical protein
MMKSEEALVTEAMQTKLSMAEKKLEKNNARWQALQQDEARKVV